MANDEKPPRSRAADAGKDSEGKAKRKIGRLVKVASIEPLEVEASCATTTCTETCENITPYFCTC